MKRQEKTLTTKPTMKGMLSLSTTRRKGKYIWTSENRITSITKQSRKSLKRYEVLFDSCSACDIFVNTEFLSNIRTCPWTLVLKTQTGECKVTMIGELAGVGTVWYYPEDQQTSYPRTGWW